MIKKVGSERLVLTLNNSSGKKSCLIICINSDSKENCQYKVTFNKSSIHSHEIMTSFKALIGCERTDKDLLKAVILWVQRQVGVDSCGNVMNTLQIGR